MRWTKRIWTSALLLAVIAGCKQQCFIKECDYNHTRDHLAGALEFKPDISEAAPVSVVHTQQPPTVLDPNRPPRYLSLAEANSLALERGTVGSAALNGSSELSLATFGGSGQLQPPGGSIRVFALDPAILAATVESSLSKFDALWQTSMSWNTTDRPIGTALDVFQAGRSGALNAIQTDAASFFSRIAKPLPTGGTAGITLSTDYQSTNLPAAVNPSYTPRLVFAMEQPLLQGFGVEVNQIRAAHPGTALIANEVPQAQSLGIGQPTQEGILVSRIRYDQSRAQFEVLVAQMLLNVEQAYWNLYGAYWNLYSREQGLRLAYESWRVTRVQYLVGGANKKTLADVARTRGQYELFRGQRIEALGRVLEAERNLRTLLGLPVEDRSRLVPSDTPTLSPYQPDWCAAVEEAVRLRPELVIAREDIKVQQLNLIERKNRLLPDLRAFATYDVNGLGSKLDGPSSANAFRNLAENNFNSWSVGMRLLVPLGYRQAHAEVRQARLNLARSFALLVDEENKTQQFLAQQYRRLFEFYEQIKAQRAQREAYGLQLKLRFLLIGEKSDLSDQTILEAQRFFAEALTNEYNAIVQYNNTLALFEYAKGSLLKHNNVIINEGPLPECARERAAEHHAKRNVALVLQERANPIHCSDGDGCNGKDRKQLMPELPQYKPASLPALFEKMPKLPEANDASDLPSPGKNVLGMPGVPMPSGKPVPSNARTAPLQTPTGANTRTPVSLSATK